MEIQSDLIILPSNCHLPLPWSVRGPLGLATGTEVSIALVHGGGETGRLPDIIVSPLQSEYLDKTYTLDVELGERSGAVADFLSWLGDSIEIRTGNKVNIVLSETITLEGGNKHKMHIVLEPALGHAPLELKELKDVINEIVENHKDDIKSHQLEPIYRSDPLSFILQQKVRVAGGWVQYNGWMTKLLERYPEARSEYDLSKVVVSSNPQQRLLRFIIPRKGVIEIKVPHYNRPGALREISKVLRDTKYNILSSRLSRTPPKNLAASTSVFVAACEPLDADVDHEILRQGFQEIHTGFMIENVTISNGKRAEKTLFLTPNRQEMVQLDPGIAHDKAKVREDVGAEFFARHNKRPEMFVFISRRFIKKNDNKLAHDEQRRTLRKIKEAIESMACAAIEADDPGHGAPEKYYDNYVYQAVFSRLWASDACLVLALDQDGKGTLSPSIGHEIGFFAGRNRPLKVFVSSARDKDPVFGNIVGKNRVTYPDSEAAFVDDEPDALYQRVRAWLETLLLGQKGSAGE